MKEIPLTQCYVALVDDEDYEWLNQWKWHVQKTHHNPSLFYASRLERQDNKYVGQLMHRQVIRAVSGEIVDHINRNGLDNRKENLRIVNHGINIANQKHSSNNSSGYKGVYWYEKRKRWRVQVGFNGDRITSRSHKDPIEAALVRDEIARQLYGEHTYLNFPDTEPTLEVIEKAHQALRRHGL